MLSKAFRRRKSRRNRRQQTTGRQHKRLRGFEPLEERRLLAAVGLDNGNLVITDTGGNTNDDWSLGLSGGSLVIGDANGNISLGAGLVGSGDGTPAVTIDPAANPAFSGSIVFNTLGGSDTLTVDSSGGSFNRDLVVSGNDYVYINGAVALSNQNFTIDADRITINGAIDTAGGDISLSATGGNASISAAISAGSGQIAITGREISLETGSLAGTGSLVLKPSDPASAISLGGVTAGFSGLYLSNQEIANLTDGFSSITIGDVANGTGTVSLAGATFTDPVTIAGGEINDISGIDITAPSVTLAGNVAANDLSIAGDLVLDGGSTFSSTFSINTDGTTTTIQQGAQQAYAGESHPDFYNIIFVTSGAISPLFPSNPGENAIERAAYQATLVAFYAGFVPGWDGVESTWRPFMSMVGLHAKDHVGIQGPMFNTQGELVATDAESFLFGGANNLVNSIKYDEAGNEMLNGSPVMAGTGNGLSNGQDCGSWEASVGSFSSVSYSTTTLYDGATGSCSSSANLIAISPPIAWPSNSFGQIDVTGGVTIGDGVTLDLDAAALAGSTMVDGDQYVLINNDSTDVVSGTFDGLPEGTTVVADVNGFDLRISYTGGSDSNDVVLLAAIPNTPPIAGDLDPTFGFEGKVTTDVSSPFEDAEAVLVQDDGKIIVIGAAFDNPGTKDDFLLIRYNPDGSLDTSFGTTGIVTTDFFGSFDVSLDAQLQNDGKIVVVGEVRTGTSTGTDFGVARYNTDGTLDNTFGIGGLITTDFFSGSGHGDHANAIAIQADGKIVVVGGTTYLLGERDFALARYNSDGTLDSSFGSGGKVTTDVGGFNEFAQDIVIQPDGKMIVVGGGTGDFLVARYNNDGSLDNSFGAGGIVTTDFFSAQDEALFVTVQPDGRIIAAGYVQATSTDWALARYNSDGSLDTSFGLAGKVTTDLSAGTDFLEAGIVLQTDGKIIAAGTSNDDFAVARYHVDGTLDDSFGVAGAVTTDFGGSSDFALGIALQLDGKIVVAGGADDFVAIARYHGDLELLPEGLADAVTELSPGGTVEVQTSPSDIDDWITAIGGDGTPENPGLPPNTSGEPITIVLTLEPGNYGASKELIIPEGFIMIIEGTSGVIEIVGNSPALILQSGELIVRNNDPTGEIRFVNNTDAPTILVEGGHLTLRNTFVHESTGGDQAAIEVRGGTVDLGTADDLGGNTFLIHGAGDLLRNSSPHPIAAIGNAFERDGIDIASNFDIEEAILDVLDGPTVGLVTYVTDNVYLTIDEGIYELDLTTLVADLATADVTFAITAATGGTATILSDNKTARFTAFDDGIAGFSYSVLVADSTLAVRSANFAVHNVAPVAADQSYSTLEDTLSTFNLLAGTDDNGPFAVTDPGILDIHTAVAGTFATTAGGSVTIAAGGDATYTPATGFAGQDTFSYTALDDDGGSGTATVAMTVRNLVDLSGRVFDDRDNYGLFGASDVGLGGVTVELFNETNLATPLATETTDTEGRYTFNANLLPGQYRIVETQPVGLLDGDETAGDLGGTVDNTQDSDAITNITVASGDPDAKGYNFANIQPSQLQGLVWEDFNADGEVNFGEKALEGVGITLSGNDDRGNAVLEFLETNGQGIFEFIDLRPSDAGGYTLTETQPTDFVDGVESLGTVNGVLAGTAADNVFSQIGLTAPGSNAMDYNFGERPAAGSTVQSGQTATIGFWQNKNGQRLIQSLNGGESATQLSNWLATTLPNMYGASAGSNSLTGMTNTEVAGVFKALFKRNHKTASAEGPPKLDAQVMATALTVYVTNETLAAAAALDYGFMVTATGLGSSTFNIGDNGAAFDVADNTELTVLDILLNTDEKTHEGLLYDQDGNNEIDEMELTLRLMANLVYTDINEGGDI